MAFAHATCPLSVTDEYLALGSGLPGFMPPSTAMALLGKFPEEDPAPFVYRSFTFCGAPFQGLRLGGDFVTPPHLRRDARMIPLPPTGNACGLSRPSGLGWFPFDRLYSGSRFAFLSSRY